MAFSATKPKGKLMYGLREFFPDVQDHARTLRNDIKCNGGQASASDVVSQLVDGKLELNELLMNVGVAEASSSTLYFLVSLWRPCSSASSSTYGPSCAEASSKWGTYLVSDDREVKVTTSLSIDTVFTYCMVDDRESCFVYLLYEVRP